MEAYNTPSDDDFMVIFDELGFMFEDGDEFPIESPKTSSPLRTSEAGTNSLVPHPSVSSNLLASCICALYPDFHIGSNQVTKTSEAKKQMKSRPSVSRRFNRAIKSSKQRSCAELVQRLPSGESMKLYAFPSFDRSDALIYLPTSLSRHMNAGDTKAVSRLLSSHLDENCAVKLSFFDLGQLDRTGLIRAYEILQELHPDTISCSTNITVTENKIKASIYSKFTDCKIIQKSMRSTVTDPVFASVVHVERIDGVRHIQQDRTEEEMNNFMELAGSEQNLLIYMCLDLEMTVDDFSKKVTEYRVSGRVTSIHPVDDTGIVV